MGGEARFSSPSGIAIDPAGNLIVADTGNHRIRKITLSLAACNDLAGASKYTAAQSCKGAQALAKWPLTTAAWIDPNLGSKDDAVKGTCDSTTAGGGWTKVTPATPAATVDALRGANGQQLLKCSDGASGGIVSPPTGAPWSWAQKTKLAGVWTVQGKAVPCGGDASFAQLGCGFGYGCSSGPTDAALLLPGVTNGNQCASQSSTQTGAAFTICGSPNYTTYSVFVRAGD